MARAVEAYHYAVETRREETPRTLDAYHTAVETRREETARSRDAYHTAAETRREAEVRASDAYHYATENVISASNPATLWVWNSSTGQYERDPWRYYDTTTSTWKQAF